MNRKPAARRGMSLVEVLAASALLGGVLIAGLSGLSTMRRAQLDLADAVRAELLARELMTEVMQQAYREPDEAAVFGPERSERTNPPSRAAFDDVDDYRRWNRQRDLAPNSKAGALLDLGHGWRRQVFVDFVSPDDPRTRIGRDRGVKRIVINVWRNSRKLTSLVALVTANRNRQTR